MLLIPFPFLTTAVLLVAWIALRAVARLPSRAFSYIDGFFVLAAAQSALLGLRHGYGWAPAGVLLPVTAVLLPPLALACFRHPPWRQALMWHAVPAALVALVSLTVVPLLDVLVPLIYLGFAAMLAAHGLSGESNLTWARLGDMPGSQLALWMMVAVLVFSTIADVVIAIDFARTRGANVGAIVMVAQSVTLVSVCLIIWRSVPRIDQPAAVEPPPANGDLAADFDTVERELRSRELHLDADLNLQRLARKTGIPAKRVSAAVNAIEGMNVSQWVNRLRIEHAQTLLADPDRLVSDVIYDSGFNTKSSFNREFRRVAGTTPSAWRRAQS
jgi:AraC-like DNA-binding protein